MARKCASPVAPKPISSCGVSIGRVGRFNELAFPGSGPGLRRFRSGPERVRIRAGFVFIRTTIHKSFRSLRKFFRPDLTPLTYLTYYRMIRDFSTRAPEKNNREFRNCGLW